MLNKVVSRELLIDLSSGSMPDLYTAVGDECGAADLQQRRKKVPYANRSSPDDKVGLEIDDPLVVL